MKKLTHLSILLVVSIFSYSQVKINQNPSLNILVNISDENFEYYLETHDTNGINVSIDSPNNMGDGILNNRKVYKSRIENVLNLDLSNLKINSIVGIEYFSLLTKLNISNNNISDINISQNIKLDWLFCSNNKLLELNVSSNLSLDRLYCANNKISSLDISKNIALDYLDCSNNKIEKLDVSKNSSLDRLFCPNNNIKTIDISNNKSIDRVDVSNNNLNKITIITTQKILLKRTYKNNEGNNFPRLKLDSNPKLIFNISMAL